MINTVKLPILHHDVALRVAKGHFATNHSHINYYIDITAQKIRLSEAQAAAKALVTHYQSNTVVDTILCMDGTGVIGACLAEELTRSGFMNINQHQTVYIIEPEIISGSQMVFRDNITPSIKGKHVLILMASVSTGYTINRAVSAVGYYGGQVAGVCAIYSMVKEAAGFPVESIFDVNDLPDYQSYDYTECPYCKAGQKIDALVNSFGYSSL